MFGQSSDRKSFEGCAPSGLAGALDLQDMQGCGRPIQVQHRLAREFLPVRPASGAVAAGTSGE